MSKFQIIFLIVLGGLILIAVLMFSGIIPGFGGIGGGGGGKAADVLMWGTIPQYFMDSVLSGFNQTNQDTFKVQYVEKNLQTYEADLVNALAAGTGPDIWILPQDLIMKHFNKAFTIPFQSYSLTSFRSNFIEEGEIFLMQDGPLAIPFLADPLVLYWNRDLFSAEGIAAAPATWDEFLADSQALTKLDDNGNLKQSGSALGTFKNVSHAKEIISALILQTGNEILNKDNSGVAWDESLSGGQSPAGNALSFYTQFSNPKKVAYSWNTAMQKSRDVFTAGKLAMYFGFGSELADIQEANPHLNFDIALIPQIKGGSIKATFGNIYGLAVSQNSRVKSQAITAIFSMTDQAFLKELEAKIVQRPARKDMLGRVADKKFLSVLNTATLQSRGWFDPNPQLTEEIFKNMVESIITGKKDVASAVSEAGQRIEAILK